eukprot:CAMPEP_0117470680 /NCGR_PEP_ID=MMETSP0784-20121206/7340_1 /TAXON_ID=39447 /ORGANISM="" /LENGTH=319 /DNA_ID=CAMNT_0005264775 /DNA_START=53 /DNA_END=1012 /DNA_ORIENTATION=+
MALSPSNATGVPRDGGSDQESVGGVTLGAMLVAAATEPALAVDPSSSKAIAMHEKGCEQKLVQEMAPHSLSDAARTESALEIDPSQCLATSVYGDLGYEQKWIRGVAPGTMFDAAQTEPALERLVRSGSLRSVGCGGGDLAASEGQRRRALVPGCGRGYALVTLAEAGFDVTGIDIAPTAITEARKYLDGSGRGARSVRLLQQDFFSVEATFDLAYDCTFLCALPPHMREAWAEQYSHVIPRGGELLTLIWPLPKHGQDQDPAYGRSVSSGPPYVISFDLVKRLLEGRQFRLVSADFVKRGDLARPKRGGEIMARWLKL